MTRTVSASPAIGFRAELTHEVHIPCQLLPGCIFVGSARREHREDARFIAVLGSEIGSGGVEGCEGEQRGDEGAAGRAAEVMLASHGGDGC